MGRPTFQFLFQAKQRLPCRPFSPVVRACLWVYFPSGGNGDKPRLSTSFWQLWFGTTEGCCYLIAFGEKLPSLPTTWRGTQVCSCVRVGAKSRGATKQSVWLFHIPPWSACGKIHTRQWDTVRRSVSLKQALTQAPPPHRWGKPCNKLAHQLWLNTVAAEKAQEAVK